MKRLIWLAVLPLLLAGAWAGRAAPQIRDYVQQQEWFARTAAEAGSARYGGVTWRPAAAVLRSRVPSGEGVALPAGRKALLLGMQVDAAQPVYQLTGCRLAIEDASGAIWPAEAEPSADLLRVLAAGRDVPGRDVAGRCDGAGYSTPEGQPVETDTLFLIGADAPAPYRLRLSTNDGRPRFLTMPLTVAP